MDGQPRLAFIMGAGASKAKPLCLPTIRELLPEAFRLAAPGAVEPSAMHNMCEYRRQFAHLKELFKQEYGPGAFKRARECWATYRDIPWADVEQLVTRADFSDNPALKRAIAYVLCSVIYQPPDQFYEPTSCGYKKKWPSLYDELVVLLYHQKTTATFITFNYDVELDKSLRMPDHSIPVAPEYYLEFQDYHPVCKGSRVYPYPLLKLHGSFNWGRCPTCDTYYWRQLDPPTLLSAAACSFCGAKLEPVLVPPTFDKSRYYKALQRLWDKAAELLEAAEVIAVVGYSFSEADEYAYKFFSRHLRSSQHLKKVIVADPCKRVVERIKEMVGLNVAIISVCDFRALLKLLKSCWVLDHQ